MKKTLYTAPVCDYIVYAESEMICTSPSATTEEFNELTEIEW